MMSIKDWYPEVLKLRGHITELEQRLEIEPHRHDGIYCRDETIRLLTEANQRKDRYIAELKATCKWCGTIHRANENTLCPVTQKDRRIKKLEALLRENQHE